MKIILILLIGLAMIFNCYSQTENEEQTINELNTLLKTIYDDSFELSSIIDIDSSDNDYFQNPYGTLSHIFLFSANSDSLIPGKILLGIYKDNNILWRSKIKLVGESESYQFERTIDLNNDGKVDIIISSIEDTNTENSLESWEIYSWDGNVLNSIYDSNEDSTSKIFMIPTSGQILDLNGDGIYEIIGDDYDYETSDGTQNIKKLVYAWNGNIYALTENDFNIENMVFTKANNLNVEIKTTVKKLDNKFSYQYEIKNNLDSKQALSSIYLKINNDSISSESPSGWENFYDFNNHWVKFFEYTFNLNKYQILDTLKKITDENEKKNFLFNFVKNEKVSKGILPGEKLDSIKIASNSVPTIISCYFQANKTQLKFFDDNNSQELAEVNDVYDNSFIKSSIGPRANFRKFIPDELINDILNYINKSLKLSWIFQQATARKYTNYFTSAKTNLQQNNITEAKNILNDVLKEVKKTMKQD